MIRVANNTSTSAVYLPFSMKVPCWLIERPLYFAPRGAKSYLTVFDRPLLNQATDNPNYHDPPHKVDYSLPSSKNFSSSPQTIITLAMNWHEISDIK